MTCAAGDKVWQFFQAAALPWLGLAVLILVAVWAAVRIRSWYRDHDDGAEAAHRMLTQFGDLHRQGALSDEEYRSIKGRLVERIDDGTRRQDNAN